MTFQVRDPQSSRDLPSRVDHIVAAHAASVPDRIAILEEERVCTYRQLHEAIASTTGWLQRQGIRQGDRVVLVCENSASAIALYIATTALDAWPVLVNARISEREIEEIRSHCGARALAFVLGGSPMADRHCKAFGSTTHQTAAGRFAIARVDETATPEAIPAQPADQVAALLYTTGTTGQPKGVMLTHRNLLFVANATAAARRLTSADRVYAALPISHALGLTGVLLGSFISGAAVYLTARFNPKAALQALTEGQITVMIGTPSMYALLVEYARRKNLVPIMAPALRLISSAGAPLDLATKMQAESVFCRILHNGYGISECGPSISLTSLDSPRNDCSVGQPLSGVEVKLSDDNHDCGELFVRSPGIMKGYYKASEQTHQVIDPEGWFRTGDLARCDADGNLFITGRAKDLIIRLGFNVYPAEIEGVLNEHPAVLRSAVIGVPSGDTEDIIAFVQPGEGTTLQLPDLSNHIAGKLAPYKRPTKIISLEQLPVAPNGKVLKASLASLATPDVGPYA